MIVKALVGDLRANPKHLTHSLDKNPPPPPPPPRLVYLPEQLHHWWKVEIPVGCLRLNLEDGHMLRAVERVELQKRRCR